MSVSDSVTRFMRDRDVEYDMSVHSPTATSQQTASVAHVPGDRLAKGVLLDDGEELVMAVIPATHKLDTSALETMLHCELQMVSEQELPHLFYDCHPGAVPPLGTAYGIATIVDDSLLAQLEVYFEGGDHQALVRVSGDGFDRLMLGNRRGCFSHHM